MDLIRAKMIAPANGNGCQEAVYPHVPPDFREAISHILETEGMMETSAENRILARMDKHQSETLSGIGELKETLHKHDTRLVLVEKDVAELKGVADEVDTLKTVAADVGALKTAAKDAADERRNTSRLVKAAIVGSVMSIIIGALVSVYGTRAPVVQEVKEAKQDVKQDTAELTQQMKELIQVLRIKATQEAAPANAPAPNKGGKRPPGLILPVLPLGPGARLREGEIITINEIPLPLFSCNQLSIPPMKVPE